MEDYTTGKIKKKNEKNKKLLPNQGKKAERLQEYL